MSAMSRETVQQEVREWLQDNWDPQLSLQAWRERLVDAGWAVPSWSSKCFGRDLPAWADQVVAEELAPSFFTGQCWAQDESLQFV